MSWRSPHPRLCGFDVSAPSVERAPSRPVMPRMQAHRSDTEFDTCHPARGDAADQLRLPFLRFYSSVPLGGLLMRRSPQPARGRLRRAVGVGAATVLLAGGVAACGKDGPADTLDEFLAGWRSGNLEKVGFVTADGSRIPARDVVDQLQSLSGDLAKTPLVLTRQGKPKVTGDIASSAVKLDWTLPGGTPWSYESTVRMTKHNSDGWRVIWEPAIVNSELSAGDKFKVRRVAADRSPIVDTTGKPIVTKQPVVTVGVSPEKIKDLPGLTKALDAAFKKAGVTVNLTNLKSR